MCQVRMFPVCQVPNDDEDENQELQDDDVCVIADERQENLRG